MKGILLSAIFVWLIAYMYAYQMDMWNVYHGKPEYIAWATILTVIYIAIASGIRQLLISKKRPGDQDKKD